MHHNLEGGKGNTETSSVNIKALYGFECLCFDQIAQLQKRIEVSISRKERKRKARKGVISL